jgi:O-methyltransferase
MRSLRHRLGSAVWPRYNTFIDQLNSNGMLNQWLRGIPDVPTFGERREYFSFLNANVIKGEALDYLEFGVYEGESIAQWAQINSHPRSRFWGFDSFLGLPERWNSRVEAGRFNVAGRVPNIDDGRVSFVKGWFNETLQPFISTFLPQSRIVVHIDADLYTSTLYCLTRLDDVMAAGSIILFDELFSALNEFRALLDWSRAYRRKVEVIARTSDEHGRFAFIVR